MDSTGSSKTENFYNNQGDMISERIYTTASNFRETKYTYDSSHRPVTMTQDGVSFTKYTYDGNGNPIKVGTGLTSADLTASESNYSASAAVTNYTYHPYLGVATAVTNPDGTTHNYSYNYFGLLDSESYTKNNSTSNVINYTYDNFGQLLSKTAGNKTESFTYDKLGNVTQTVDESGTTSFTYDTLGRMTEEARNDGVKKQYTYDANNNRTSFIMYTNNTVQQQNLGYVYDALNRVTSITENSSNIASYTYNKNSQLLTENNVVVQSAYTYNVGGMVTNKTTTNAGGTTLQTDNYTYYLDGNVKTENGKTYTYDSNNRLSNVAEGTNNTAYTFDARGNRLTKTGDNMMDKVYDKNNRIVHYVTDDLEGNFWYDVRGNMTAWQEKTLVDGLLMTAHDYSFDSLGRMNRYESYYSGDIAYYEYNSSGLRTSKSVTNRYSSGENNTDYIYDGINIIAEITDGDVTNYVRGLTGIIYRKAPDGTKTYYVTNNHGDVTKLVNSSGTVIQTYTYDEYGNVKSRTGTDTNPFRYCGEYYDEESGLIYLRARYYSPQLGRFISEDPARDDLNWYVYCASNPINFWDPLGLDPGDHFESPDEAAADFGLYIGQKSIDIEEEFASCIYEGVDENGNLYYFYDIPRNELETHEERSITFYITWDGTYGEPIAITHTHGAYDANTSNTKDGFSTPGNVLSGDDSYSDTYNSDSLNIDYYVVTPAGNLYRYDSGSGNYSGTLISSDMPVDSRIEIHQNMENTLLWNLLQNKFNNASAQDLVNAKRKKPDDLMALITELQSEVG